MSNYTTNLIPGGFQVLKDGEVLINQPFDYRTSGFAPIADADRQALADSIVAELTAHDTAQVQ